MKLFHLEQCKKFVGRLMTAVKKSLDLSLTAILLQYNKIKELRVNVVRLVRACGPTAASFCYANQKWLAGCCNKTPS